MTIQLNPHQHEMQSSVLLPLEEVDARLFVAVCSALSMFPAEIETIFAKLGPITSSQLAFNSPVNLLRVLLFYVSPVSVSVNSIALVASDLVLQNSAGSSRLTDLLEEAEDMLIWISNEYHVASEEPELAVFQIASDIVINLAGRAKSVGFLANPVDSDPKECLFSFVKAKVFELGKYHAQIGDLSPLFRVLEGYEPFDRWYQGVVLPYVYFWTNYASLNDKGIIASEFLGIRSYWDQFDYLLAPLDRQDFSYSEKVSIENYLSNVILPFAVYNGTNLQPLLKWMFETTHSGAISAQFLLWHKSLETIMSFSDFKGAHLEEQAYAELLRYYVAACYYFALVQEPDVASVEHAKIYDQISETVNSLVSGKTPSMAFSTSADYSNLPDFASLLDFVSSTTNPVLYLFRGSLEESLSTLQQIISTCCQLYAVNGLTILEYLQLKGSQDMGFDTKQREVTKILSQVDESNYKKLLASVDTFSSVFIAENHSQRKEIDQLVVERLLNVNLFSLVLEFYQTKSGDQKLSPDVMFTLTVSKFWDLFDNSTNLDERIGRMKDATRCIEMLEVISLEHSLDEENRHVIIRLKHLLKAVRNLKNFKLVLEKQKPTTPKEILSRLTRSNRDDVFSPISLVTIILEQNPKSYLAFEKLYKIVNDLAIYLELEITDMFLPKVQSACIESALVDNNFDFACKQSKDLFTYYTNNKHSEQLNEFWLTFYQVGKYILPDWYNDFDESVESQKIEILTKQRELLSLTLKLTKPSTSTVDHSKLIINQIKLVNLAINEWYDNLESRRAETVYSTGGSSQTHMQKNITGLLNEATNSTNQAGEKLSNLFVSGLGWAIGAKRSELDG